MLLETFLERGRVYKKMKQTKTLYSFLNWIYDLLNLYQKNSEAKRVKSVRCHA